MNDMGESAILGQYPLRTKGGVLGEGIYYGPPKLAEPIRADSDLEKQDAPCRMAALGRTDDITIYGQVTPGQLLYVFDENRGPVVSMDHRAVQEICRGVEKNPRKEGP